MESLSRKDLFWWLGLLAFATVALVASWVGFIGSDDGAYLRGAEGWLESGAFAGGNHWEIRHLVVIPMALSIKLLGPSELATTLPTVLTYLGLLSLVFVIVRKQFGLPPAALATALAATVPLLAIHASIPGVDMTEPVLALLSVWCFHRAADAEHPARRLVLSGIFAGLAVLTRETSLALVVFYTLLFLGGACFPRRMYLFGALGMALPVAAEMAYFLATTGDALHRYSINVERLSDRGGVAPTAVGSPLGALFKNLEFGVLFFLAIPTGLALAFDRSLRPSEKRLLGLLTFQAVVGFVFLAYFANLRALPRYYVVPCVVGVILIALWATRIQWAQGRWIVVLACGGFVASNALFIAVSNRSPMFAERALAEFAASTDEPVHTDPRTAGRSRRFLLWAGVDVEARIRSAPPPPGALYFYHSRSALKGRINWLDQFDPLEYAVQEDWPEVWSKEAAPRLAGRMLELFGGERLLSPGTVERIRTPNPGVAVYRVE